MLELDLFLLGGGYVVSPLTSVVLHSYAQLEDALLRDFEEIQKSLEIDSALKQIDVAAFHAVMAVFSNINASDRAAKMSRIHVHHQLLMSKHAELTARLPEANPGLNGVNAAMAKDPSNANMNQLIRELAQSEHEFTHLSEAFQQKRCRMSELYRNLSDTRALMTLLLGMLGLGSLCVITGLFFRR